MVNVARWCVIVILAGLVVGCGPLKTRKPVPVELVDSVSIDNYSRIRFWGDTSDTALVNSLTESWEQERQALGLPPDASKLPPASYLTISGGGSDGAYGAGLLLGWTDRGDRPTFKIVAGISTGALTAPFAFLGSSTDPQLRKVYTEVGDKDIAIFAGFFNLFRGDSAYNTAPLNSLTEKTVTNEMIDLIAAEHRKGRRLFVGTTNIDVQRPVIWDMGAIANSDNEERYKLFRRVLLASAAIPGVFPPIYFKVRTPDGTEYDEMHVDGGVTREMFLLPSQLNLAELRQKHRGERDQITLYVIRNARLGPEFAVTPPRAVAIAERSIATLIKAQSIGDIVILHDEATRHGWRFRLAAIPEDIASDARSMFDQDHMKMLFSRGYNLARNGYEWQEAPPTFDDLARTNSVRNPSTLPATVP